MAKPPAFQLYAGNFMSDPLVDAMTPEELGGYFRLLLVAWQYDGGHLPDDEALLASWSRLGRRWKKCAPAILRCFRKSEDGRLFQKRMVEVAREQSEFRELQRQKGLSSAKSRKQKKDAQPLLNSGCESVDVGFQPEGNSLSSSLSSSEISDTEREQRTQVRNRLIAGFRTVDVLTPDAQTLHACVDDVMRYANASGRSPESIATDGFAAAKKLSGSWTVKRLTPVLFHRHWDAIQQIMGGADPTPRSQSRGPPEPPQRQYEDFGDIAKRLEDE